MNQGVLEKRPFDPPSNAQHTNQLPKSLTKTYSYSSSRYHYSRTTP